MTDKSARRPDPEKVLNRLAALCSRSEQCSCDIAGKLLRSGIGPDDQQRIMRSLVRMGFIDDTRFARSFANDKVRFSGWGRRKIRIHLMSKRIEASDIDAALAAIDPADYKDALIRSARAKSRSLHLTEVADRQKLMRHLVSRGFEPDIVIRLINALASRLNS